MRPLSGIFYRIIFKQYSNNLLDGVISKERRFHHNGEAAFYCSPTPEAASIAIDRYVGSTDPQREIWSLKLSNLNVIDIRSHSI